MKSQETRRQKRLEKATRRFDSGPIYFIGVVGFSWGILLTSSFFLFNRVPTETSLYAPKVILLLLVNIVLGLIVGWAIWIGLKRFLRQQVNQQINLEGE